MPMWPPRDRRGGRVNPELFANVGVLLGIEGAAVLGEQAQGGDAGGGEAGAKANAVGPDLHQAARERDCRKIGGTRASWIFSRLFSDQGWMRVLDFEVGENRG